MATAVTRPDPGRFNMETFSELLFQRETVIGEAPVAYATFHGGLMQSLVPTSPYECVVAEKLIALEWELTQHRTMRNACLRHSAVDAVMHAVVSFIEENWKSGANNKGGAITKAKARGQKPTFDMQAATAEGADLAKRATSADEDVRNAACSEITAMGMDPLEVMSAAYRSSGTGVTFHGAEIQDLEKRSREVKREYDALQKARLLEPPVVDAGIQDACVVEEAPVKPKKPINWI